MFETEDQYHRMRTASQGGYTGSDHTQRPTSLRVFANYWCEQ
jgi:hypothetical protein